MNTTYTYYTATMDQDGLTILKDVHAGVSGPIRASEVPVDMAAADAWLTAEGFHRTGSWTTRKSYNGLTLQAALIPA